MPVSNTILRYVITGFYGSVLMFSLAGCSSLPEPEERIQREAEIELFFQKWQGTNYQYGGNDGAGIDCSALMVEAYIDVFDISLPRTTEDQSDLGKRVRKRKIDAGDLVFFKTGLINRHVGIYLKDGIFIHASRSAGVVKSSLDSGYWADNFWKAKRVLN